MRPASGRSQAVLWHLDNVKKLATCRHEAAHALRAYAHNFLIERIFLDHDGGMTIAEFPFSTAALPAAYRDSPARTARHLLGIIETILAGAAIICRHH